MSSIIPVASPESITCNLVYYTAPHVIFVFIFIYCLLSSKPPDDGFDNKKALVIIYCQIEKLGKQNPIKVQKCLFNLVGTVKSSNSTLGDDLIVECIDKQQGKKKTIEKYSPR